MAQVTFFLVIIFSGIRANLRTVRPSVGLSVGQLARWSVGPLVRWSVGALVRWSVGPFVDCSKSTWLFLRLPPSGHCVTALALLDATRVLFQGRFRRLRLHASAFAKM